MAKVYKGSVAYYMYLLLDLHNENEQKINQHIRRLELKSIH